MTYQEHAIGNKKLDWWDALNNPEKYNHGDLINDGFSWVTCACGNLCNSIPRRNGGAPLDFELRKLSRLFGDQVFNKHWDEAKATLTKIEARSAIVLSQIK